MMGPHGSMLFRTITVLWFVSICTVLNSCTSDGPTVSDTAGGLMMSTSFEEGSAASFGGWVPQDTGAVRWASFSHDVPPNGGLWSLQLTSDSTQSHRWNYPLRLNGSKNDARFILSYWMKRVGNVQTSVDLAVLRGNLIEFHMMATSAETVGWEQVVDTITPLSQYPAPIDSTTFSFSVTFHRVVRFPPVPTDTGFCRIDNIRVETIPF